MTAIACQTKPILCVFVQICTSCAYARVYLYNFGLFVYPFVVVDRWVCLYYSSITFVATACCFIFHTPNFMCIAVVWTFVLLCIFNIFCSLGVLQSAHTRNRLLSIADTSEKSSNRREEKKSVEKGKNRNNLGSQSARKLFLYILEIKFHADFER